jgi:hypothetical protein
MSGLFPCTWICTASAREGGWLCAGGGRGQMGPPLGHSEERNVGELTAQSATIGADLNTVTQ